MHATNPELVIPALEKEFRRWLESKGIEIGPDGVGRRRDGALARASMRSLERGSETLLRCALVEQVADDADWTTEILASSGGWLQISVRNSQGSYAAVPNLAKALMQQLDLRDASLELRNVVRMWDVSELDQLVELLLSPERHGLVLVAGTGPDPQLFDAFNQRLPRWISEAYGLAQVVSLTPQATLGLGRRLEEHATNPWTIRTYYPGLRLGSSVDARRHRYLSVATLAQQSDARIRKLLGTVARSHASQRELPLEVVEARRAFERADARTLIDRMTLAVSEKPSIDGEPSDTTNFVNGPSSESKGAETGTEEGAVARICSILGLDEFTEESVIAAMTRVEDEVRTSLQAEVDTAAELLEEQLERIETLEDANRGLTLASEDYELDRAELMVEVDRLSREVKWLRGQLAESHGLAVAYEPVPEDDAPQHPTSCEELIECLGDEGVVFTGDLGPVRAVDECDTFGACVREAHMCVISLRDYLRAKAVGDAPNGVDHFLRHRPSGYEGVSPGKHAATETGYTKAHHGSERIFPVPVEVEETGRAPMLAHFKLARLGMVSPRLHYLDDSLNTGKIYIGYLGPHLTNRHTN